MTKHDPHFPRLYRNYIMSAHRIFWLCCLKTGAKPFAELPNFHTVDYLNCICKSCHVEFLFCVSVSVLSLCLMHTCYSWTRFPFEKEILISNVRVCVSQSTSGSSLIATVKLQLREKKRKKRVYLSPLHTHSTVTWVQVWKFRFVHTMYTSLNCVTVMCYKCWERLRHVFKPAL